MNWLNAFELMCYIIVSIELIDLVRKKDYNALFTFGAAALVGFTMELLAVNVTDIYYYNQGFWLSVGAPPKQFPVFGGLMWGGLTVYGIKLAKKLGFGKLLTALCAGMLVVTMDLLLDVVAIRLDGGFWTWVGKPIDLTISASTFMSVIWVNFLGYMIETPVVTGLTLKKCERVRKNEWKRQILFMLLIALGAIVITGIGSLVALWLNSLTADLFACIAFVIIWLIMAVVIIAKAVKGRLKIGKAKTWDIPMLVFWLAMYGYCLAAIMNLEIQKTHPWFLALGVLFTGGTAYLCLAESLNEH